MINVAIPSGILHYLIEGTMQLWLMVNNFLHENVDLQPETFFDKSLSGSQLKLFKPHALNFKVIFLSARSNYSWNSLPSDAAKSDSINDIKVI